MKAVDLPLVSAEETGVVYLVLPGFDEEEHQGIQYEIYPERNVLMVYFYESGFEEPDDSQGTVVPVALDDRALKRVQEMRSLHVVNPDSIQDREEITAQDRERIQSAYDSFAG